MHKSVLPVLLIAFGCFGSCVLAWLDHPISSSLRRELADRSRHGLALATVSRDPSKPGMNLRFFDGRTSFLPVAGCTRDTYCIVSSNRIIMNHADHVIEADASGIPMAKSLPMDVAPVAISPDGNTFAGFGGQPGRLWSDWGIWIVGFHDQKLKGFRIPLDRDDRWGELDQTMWPSLDWSPDGKNVVYSFKGSVCVLDTATWRSRTIAEGGLPRWSPSGDLIAFVTRKREAALLNLATGKWRLIDPKHQTGRAPEWSPDGRYLLLEEDEGSHVPYGCVWVHRLSDGAYVPLLYYGTADLGPRWIQLPT